MNNFCVFWKSLSRWCLLRLVENHFLQCGIVVLSFDVNTSLLKMLIAASLSISKRYCSSFLLPNTYSRLPNTFEIRLSFRSSLVLVFRPVSFPSPFNVGKRNLKLWHFQGGEDTIFSYLRNWLTAIIARARIKAKSVERSGLAVWDAFRLVTYRPAVTADSCYYAGDIATSNSSKQILPPSDGGPHRVFTAVCYLPFRSNTFSVFTDFGFT